MSINSLVKIEEPEYKRAFYIYSHDEFYNTASA